MTIWCFVVTITKLCSQAALTSVNISPADKDSAIHYFTDTSNIRGLYPHYILVGLQRNHCKSVDFIFKDTSRNPLTIAREKNKVSNIESSKAPLLKIRGNIYYDLFYQSNIDTPYHEKDVYQHTIRTSLDITVKGQYPLHLIFTGRFSNSNMLGDFSGLGLQFHENQFKKVIETKLRNYIMQYGNGKEKLDSLQRLIEQTASELNVLRNYIESPGRPQEIASAKERIYAVSRQSIFRKSTNTLNKDIFLKTGNFEKTYLKNFIKPKHKDAINTLTDSLNTDPDSVLLKLEHYQAECKKRYDSLLKQLSCLNATYEKTKLNAAGLTDKSKNLNSSTSSNDLAALLQTTHIPDSILPKGYKKLLAIKSAGIGRTTVDYSELTVKNITIKGLQFEYNPSWYVAFATGVIDYRFRGFIAAHPNQQQQYLNIVRVGKGLKESNNIIVSFYQGKKQLYNYSSSVSNNDHNIAGFSIESRLQVDKNNFVIVEAGKSALPYFRRRGKDNMVESGLNFHDHSNEAYSIKFASYLPATSTRINGFYKHTGADFQCFNYYTTNSTQNAWLIKADQPLFKRKLNLIASLRKNDFISPYLNNSYQSNTIFKSIQAIMHIKKWPVVSIGYFPSSQLIKLNDERFTENLYYTFTANISHHYFYKRRQMNSLFSFMQFYNKQSDSAFVYYNTKNFMLNQYVYFNSFTMQLNVAEAVNKNYSLYTIGGNIQLKLKKWLQAGGGLKYNNQIIINDHQIGYNMNATIIVAKIGTIQFFAEKAFIPSVSKSLVENKVGRLTFIKIF